MANQSRKRKDRDPNQDVQPWLGWVAALAVVLFVVIAVAMGMERTGNQGSVASPGAMTPLVGGMEVVAVTTTPGQVATSTDVEVALAPTTTVTSTLDTETAAGGEALTATTPITITDEVTQEDELTTTASITEGTSVTVTEATTAVVGATENVPATPPADTAEEATPVATRVPATATPTPQPVGDAPEFAPGDVVVGSSGQVAVYADASTESILLDSYGTSVELTVLEPSGDYTSYPVINEGESWLRVRALDGLVGWVNSEDVELQ